MEYSNKLLKTVICDICGKLYEDDDIFQDFQINICSECMSDIYSEYMQDVKKVISERITRNE